MGLTALDYQILRTAQTGLEGKAVEWVFDPDCKKADWTNLRFAGLINEDGSLTSRGKDVPAFELEVVTALKEGGRLWYSARVGNSYYERKSGHGAVLDLAFTKALIEKYDLLLQPGAGLWYTLPKQS